MKNKRWKIACSVLALVLSVLSSALAYGFMGVADNSFAIRFTCGLVFMITPIFVLQLVLLLWQKE